MYNLDDDNEYDDRLWDSLRQLGARRVGVLAVQLQRFRMGEIKTERPLYATNGRFLQFKSGWCYGSNLALSHGPRRFCVDMAGFAFDAALLRGRQDPLWKYVGSHYFAAFGTATSGSRLEVTSHGTTVSGGATWRGGESEFIAGLASFPE